MILLQGSLPIALGIATGLVLALYLSRLVESFLVGVTPFDALTFTVATIALAGLALAASYVPRVGRRASSPCRRSATNKIGRCAWMSGST